jgi:electron transfer flavoprotein beta subunit
VIVIAPDLEGAEDILFTAAAAGADRLIRIVGLGEVFSNHQLSLACQPVIAELEPDLILTGVQAPDDLDGQVGPILAGHLDMPYIGYIAGMVSENGDLVVKKEFAGGLVAKMRVNLPAVIGIQAAESPPRYIAFSRVRQAKNTAIIEDVEASPTDIDAELVINSMYKPEVAARAVIFTGGADEISDQVIGILKEAGVV